VSSLSPATLLLDRRTGHVPVRAVGARVAPLADLTGQPGELSEKKVIAALAPFCVDRFRKSADATQSAELLKFTTNYERGSFLEKAGYTGLPGSTESNWAVGRACGDLLAIAPKK
jgi:hypothetical protein